MAPTTATRALRPALCTFLLFGSAISWAQAQDVPPPLGTIDFYGLRTISESEVRNLLPLKEGFDFTGELPDSDTVVSEMADALGVARVELSLICCNDDGLSQLYVGIQETDRANDLYYSAPTGDVRLPPAIVENFDVFLDRMMQSVFSGEATEDRSQGHERVRAVNPGHLFLGCEPRVLHGDLLLTRSPASSYITRTPR